MTINVLITGAASGLGLAAARRAAELGARLILLDVKAENLHAACAQLTSQHQGLVVHPYVVDLSDLDATRKLAIQLARAHPVLEVLINNAGIYPPAQRQLSAQGHELALAIAHWGHLVLTHGLWPSLQAATAARVVSVSSLAHRGAAINLDDLNLARHYHPFLAYKQAKMATLLFALGLQKQAEQGGSKVSSLAAHPGVVATPLGRHRLRSSTDNWHQRLATFALAWGMQHFGQSADVGVRSITAAAFTAQYAGGSFIGPVGGLEMFGAPGRCTPSIAHLAPDITEAFWQKSNQIAQLVWS